MEEQWVVDRCKLRAVWLEHPEWSKRPCASRGTLNILGEEMAEAAPRQHVGGSGGAAWTLSSAETTNRTGGS